MQKEINNNQQDSQRKYIPAAGKDWHLPLYDPLCKLFGIDSDRKKLIDQAAIASTHRILDIGCGTGTLILLIKQHYPEVEVVGLDPNPKALARAKRKAERVNYVVQLDQGFSDELPYTSSSFDRVFSSFMLHHLKTKEKESMLHEVRRVLKPNGSLHLLDIENPESKTEKSLISRQVHSNPILKDNSEAKILRLMSLAGFAQVKKICHKDIFFGRIAYYMASVP